MKVDKVTYDPETGRFSQGNNMHQDYIECPTCHTNTMKLVSETKDEKYYRCVQCFSLMSVKK